MKEEEKEAIINQASQKAADLLMAAMKETGCNRHIHSLFLTSTSKKFVLSFSDITDNFDSWFARTADALMAQQQT